jgi:hypothetical protein
MVLIYWGESTNTIKKNIEGLLYTSMDVCVAVNAEIKYLHLYSHDSVVICEIHI